MYTFLIYFSNINLNINVIAILPFFIFSDLPLFHSSSIKSCAQMFLFIFCNLQNANTEPSGVCLASSRIPDGASAVLYMQ